MDPFPDRADKSFSSGMLAMILGGLLMVFFAAVGFAYLGTNSAVVPANSTQPPGQVVGGKILAAALSSVSVTTTTSPSVNSSSSSSSSSFATACTQTAVAACGGHLIAIELSSAADSRTLLEKLRAAYPLASTTLYRLSASVPEPPASSVAMPTYIDSVLKPLLNEMEGHVQAAVDATNHSDNLVVYLPPHDVITPAFLSGLFRWNTNDGVALFFNGRTVAQRHPGVRFVVGGVGDSTLDSPQVFPAGSLLRVVDVNSELTDSVLRASLALISVAPADNTSRVVVATQRHSARAKERLQRLANLPFAQWQFVPVTVDFVGDERAGVLQTEELVSALQQSMATPGGPLLLVLNFGPSLSVQRAAAVALSHLLAPYAGDARLVVWPLGFVPPTSDLASLPVPLARGLEPVVAAPTEDLARLGWPRQRALFLNATAPPDLALLDAAKLASVTSTCYPGASSPPTLVSGQTLKTHAGTNTLATQYLMRTDTDDAYVLLDNPAWGSS